MLSMEDVRSRFLVAEEAATLRLADTWAAARLDIESRLAAAVADGRSLSDIAYLKSLEGDVASVTSSAIAASRTWVDGTLATAYVEGALTHASGYAFSLLDDAAVKAASAYTAGLITQVGLEMQNAVHAKIMSGIAGAWDAARLRDEIVATGLQRGPWRSAEQRAAVVARTETMRAYNAGAIEGIRSTDTAWCEWIASPDERTCGICGPRHESHWLLTEVPIPGHPRCRCTVRAWYPDADSTHLRPTPPEGGPTEGAYDEWLGRTQPAGRPGAPPYQPWATHRDLMDAHMTSSSRASWVENVARQRAEDAGAGAVRMTNEEYLAAVQRHLVTLLNESPPCINRSAGSALKIIQDGRFKTQFETQTSSGMLSTEGRTRAERGLFHYADDLPVEQRPVYGSMGGTDMYGEVKFTLKSSVRTRTTWTGDDSLGSGWAMEAGQVDSGFVYPSPLTDPHPASLMWSPYTRRDYLAALQPSDLTDLYVEIQVHGGVGLDDVLAIDFGGTPLPAAQQAILDARRIAYTNFTIAEPVALAEPAVAEAAARFLSGMLDGTITRGYVDDLVTKEYLTSEGLEGARRALTAYDALKAP